MLGYDKIYDKSYDNYATLKSILTNPNFNPNKKIIDDQLAWVAILKYSPDENLINYVLNNPKISLDDLNDLNLMELSKLNQIIDTKSVELRNRLKPAKMVYFIKQYASDYFQTDLTNPYDWSKFFKRQYAPIYPDFITYEINNTPVKFYLEGMSRYFTLYAEWDKIKLKLGRAAD